MHMRSSDKLKAEAGAANLLQACAGIEPGMKVLFVNEDGAGVDRELVSFLEGHARELGAQVSSIWPSRASSPDAIAPDVMDAIDAADCAIFNHQLGPMLRLRPPKGGGTKVLNYATSWPLLESPYAHVPYALWTEVMRHLGPRLGAARQWRIQCPAGTDISGEFVPPAGKGGPGGFTLNTFPMDTHAPMAIRGTHGRLALRWLVTSAMHDLGTEGLGLGEPVTGTVEEGRITGFEGTPAGSRQARDFLAGIGERFGKDPFRLNSWHAGVNPQTRVAFAAAKSLEQWMLLAHASPRILHFHAVGETMPGEISIAVLDPTVTIDGRVWWEAGQFRLLDDPEFQDIAGRWPGQAPFEPQQDIGV